MVLTQLITETSHLDKYTYSKTRLNVLWIFFSVLRYLGGFGLLIISYKLKKLKIGSCLCLLFFKTYSQIKYKILPYIIIFFFCLILNFFVFLHISYFIPYWIAWWKIIQCFRLFSKYFQILTNIFNWIWKHL